MRNKKKKAKFNPKKERGKYRMGLLLVMFDLPIDTARERKLAHQFREHLIDGGYLMLQYSVYVKPGVTWDSKERCVNYLRQINPGTGDIRCIFITDAQWMKMDIISERKKRIGKKKRRIDDHKDIAEQLQFWD